MNESLKELLKKYGHLRIFDKVLVKREVKAYSPELDIPEKVTDYEKTVGEIIEEWVETYASSLREVAFTEEELQLLEFALRDFVEVLRRSKNPTDRTLLPIGSELYRKVANSRRFKGEESSAKVSSESKGELVSKDRLK